MSYCRWNSESDVYIFEHIKGFFICQCCSLIGSRDFTTVSRERLKKHVQEHRDRGDRVPNKVFSRLQNEINTKGKFI